MNKREFNYDYEEEQKKKDLIYDFQEKYETREKREEALRRMSNEEIDELIKSASSIQCKIYLSKFKK